MARSADLRPLTRRVAVLLAVVLGLALGVVQMAGHAHRIAHVHGQEHHDCETEHDQAFALFAPADAEHNCAAFDAATLGDGPPAAAVLEHARAVAPLPAGDGVSGRGMAACASRGGRPDRHGSAARTSGLGTLLTLTPPAGRSVLLGLRVAL
jgi:hypothetical protein